MSTNLWLTGGRFVGYTSFAATPGLRGWRPLSPWHEYAGGKRLGTPRDLVPSGPATWCQVATATGAFAVIRRSGFQKSAGPFVSQLDSRNSYTANCFAVVPSGLVSVAAETKWAQKRPTEKRNQEGNNQHGNHQHNHIPRTRRRRRRCAMGT